MRVTVNAASAAVNPPYDAAIDGKLGLRDIPHRTITGHSTSISHGFIRETSVTSTYPTADDSKPAGKMESVITTNANFGNDVLSTTAVFFLVPAMVPLIVVGTEKRQSEEGRIVQRIRASVVYGITTTVKVNVCLEISQAQLV